MMITVLYEEIFDFLAANVAFVLTVDSAEGCIGFKRLAAAKRLALLLDWVFFLSDHDHQTRKFGSYDRRHLLVVALPVALTCGCTNAGIASWLMLNGWLVINRVRRRLHRIAIHGFVMNIIPLCLASQRWQSATFLLLLMRLDRVLFEFFCFDCYTHLHLRCQN